jgi:putative ABC transport system substrate-binding protein
LTTGWQVNASYEHYWTPQFHESFYGGIEEVRYNSQANNILCTAEGAGIGTLTGSLAVAAPGCNNNFDIWSVGSRLQYDFTKSLLASFNGEANVGLIAMPDIFTADHRDLIISLATKYRLPAISWLRSFAAGGGLMSYGVDLPDLFRRAASYVDRILKGEKPADLPVQQPTKFELLINLKTAKALGLTVPPELLTQADEVIE